MTLALLSHARSASDEAIHNDKWIASLRLAMTVPVFVTRQERQRRSNPFAHLIILNYNVKHYANINYSGAKIQQYT
jgi:hypothetical protein